MWPGPLVLHAEAEETECKCFSFTDVAVYTLSPDLAWHHDSLSVGCRSNSKFCSPPENLLQISWEIATKSEKHNLCHLLKCYIVVQLSPTFVPKAEEVVTPSLLKITDTQTISHPTSIWITTLTNLVEMRWRLKCGKAPSESTKTLRLPLFNHIACGLHKGAWTEVLLHFTSLGL